MRLRQTYYIANSKSTIKDPKKIYGSLIRTNIPLPSKIKRKRKVVNIFLKIKNIQIISKKKEYTN